MLLVLCLLQLSFIYDDSFKFVLSLSWNDMSIYDSMKNTGKKLKLLKLEKFAYYYESYWQFWLIFVACCYCLQQKYLCS